VTLFWNGDRVGARALPQDWAEIGVHWAAAASPQVATLTLVHARAQSPQQATGGASSDTRTLTAAYDWICALPATTSAAPPGPSTP
jgi:hypothetical protein